MQSQSVKYKSDSRGAAALNGTRYCRAVEQKTLCCSQCGGRFSVRGSCCVVPGLSFRKDRLRNLLVMGTLSTKSWAVFLNPFHTWPAKHPEDDGRFAVIIHVDWIEIVKLELKGSVIHSNPTSHLASPSCPPGHWFSNFSVHQNYLGRFLKIQVPRPCLPSATSGSGVQPETLPL